MNHQEPITTAEYTYTAVFEPAQEGGYVVYFPSLPGVVTEGRRSKKHARWPPTC